MLMPIPGSCCEWSSCVEVLFSLPAQEIVLNTRRFPTFLMPCVAASGLFVGRLAAHAIVGHTDARSEMIQIPKNALIVAPAKKIDAMQTCRFVHTERSKIMLLKRLHFPKFLSRLRIERSLGENLTRRQTNKGEGLEKWEKGCCLYGHGEEKLI